ncbi:MAG: phage holin family protein [Burkholderiaceae bacterium]
MSPRGQPSAPGLLGRVRNLAASLLEIIETRISLASTEFQQQADRYRRAGLLLLAGVFFAAMTLIFASLLIIAAFWDTHRIAAAAGVALFYLVGTAICVVAVQRLLRQSSRPFEATLAELRHDIDRLRR